MATEAFARGRVDQVTKKRSHLHTNGYVYAGRTPISGVLRRLPVIIYPRYTHFTVHRSSLMICKGPSFPERTLDASRPSETRMNSHVWGEVG